MALPSAGASVQAVEHAGLSPISCGEGIAEYTITQYIRVQNPWGTMLAPPDTPTAHPKVLMSTLSKNTPTTTTATGLRTGDVIQARQPGTLLVYQGTVELVAPHRGFLWIRHGAFDERKLIDATEYRIVKLLD